MRSDTRPEAMGTGAECRWRLMEEESRTAYGFLKGDVRPAARPLRGRRPPACAKRAPRAPRPHHLPLPRLLAARARGRTNRRRAGRVAGLVLAGWTLGIVVIAQREGGLGVPAGGLLRRRGRPGGAQPPFGRLRSARTASCSWSGPGRRRCIRRGAASPWCSPRPWPLDPLHLGRRKRRAGGPAGRAVGARDRGGLRGGAILFDIRSQRLTAEAPAGSPGWTRSPAWATGSRSTRRSAWRSRARAARAPSSASASPISTT